MIEDYLNAKKKGDWACRRALLFGGEPHLPSLEEILKTEEVQGESRLGTLEIPMSEIVGTSTTGRRQAFAGNFMPILGAKTEFAMKWSALYDSALTEGIRDPIIVYEYLHHFYVLEGNKRVSVMKYNGAVSIPAEVTRILPCRTEDRENQIYFEFVEFFKGSQMYRLNFSESGSFEKFCKLLGKEMGEPWDRELQKMVKSSFDRFREEYLSRGGDHLPITTGDAFLLYCSVYGIHTLEEDSTKEIRHKLLKIWKEYRKKAGEVTLVMEPEELGRETSLADLFPGTGPRFTKEHPLRLAYFYERNKESSGWAYAHELGRIAVAERFPELVITEKYENLGNEEALRLAMEEAREKGNRLFITTGGRMVESAVRFALKYPELSVLNCSVNTSYNSIRTYYGRMYEAKFLMGALAASLSDAPVLGYLENSPLYGTLANINAFAIGAQMIRPSVKVRLLWTGTRDCDWRKEFAKEGIHMISGMEFSSGKTPSREFGIFSFREDGGVQNYAAPFIDWGRYDTMLVQTYLDGSFQENRLVKGHHAINYWFGLRSSVISVILSDQLPYASRKLIGLLERELREGHMSPFEGEIHTRDGIFQSEDGAALSPEEIVDMRWLNDNILGEIPPLSDFTEDAQELIRVGGFLQ